MKSGAEEMYSINPSNGDNVDRVTYYAFVDIDENGIDELFLDYGSSQAESYTTSSNNGYGTNVQIYTLDGGSNVRLLICNSDIYIPVTGHDSFIHVYQDRHYINKGFWHSPQDDILYELKDGILSSEPVMTFCHGGTGIWEINGMPASQEQCQDALMDATNNYLGYEMTRYMPGEEGEIAAEKADNAKDTNIPASDAEVTSNIDFIFSDSDQRYLTKEDLLPLDAYSLKIARNEIYARKGRMFISEDLQAYFSSKTWYNGTIPADDFDESILNDYERENAYFILDYENGDL